jgi:BON domain-containing protein
MRQRTFISIAVLAALFAAACSRKPDDTAIVTSIQSQMFSDPELKNASLHVTSANGEVTLIGSVPTVLARLDAYKIATQTHGVTKVNDQMTVLTTELVPSSPTPAASPARKPPAEHKPRVKKPKPVPQENQEIAQNVSRPAQPEPFVPPAPEPPPAAPQPPPPPPPQPKEIEVSANSTITIRMIDGVDSSVNQVGEIFHASLAAPIVVNDEVIVPSGADVYVRLSSANQAGHYTGKSELHLDLVKLEFQGRSYSLVSGTYSVAGSSRGKNTAAKVGGGAALGAIIGAAAGGGAGAAIGAGAGAAGGAVWNGVTRGKKVRIPSETKLDFQLEQPVTITVMPRQSHAAE